MTNDLRLLSLAKGFAEYLANHPPVLASDHKEVEALSELAGRESEMRKS